MSSNIGNNIVKQKIKIKLINNSLKIIFENRNQVRNFKQILKNCNCFTGKLKDEIKLFNRKIKFAVS